VVLAAGWWSRAVAERAGAPIPLVAVKRYLYVTPQLASRRVEQFPLIVGDLGPYARPEHNGLMMGWDERPARPAGSERFPAPPQDAAALEREQDALEPGYGRGIEDYGIEVLAALAEFLPWLADEGAVEHAACGYYEVTPDDKAILGEDPRVKGLFHASGFSGHGIMHAPAAGRAIADLLAGETPPFDLAGFALQPLLENRARVDPERMVI
jgi:glycine/D-amino acid oxidase-like deaminating enzyme